MQIDSVLRDRGLKCVLYTIISNEKEDKMEKIVEALVQGLKDGKKMNNDELLSISAHVNFTNDVSILRKEYLPEARKIIREEKKEAIMKTWLDKNAFFTYNGNKIKVSPSHLICDGVDAIFFRGIDKNGITVIRKRQDLSIQPESVPGVLNPDKAAFAKAHLSKCAKMNNEATVDALRGLNYEDALSLFKGVNGYREYTEAKGAIKNILSMKKI